MEQDVDNFLSDFSQQSAVIPARQLLFETTKEERKTFVKNIINEIIEGNADPLKVHVQVKSLENLVKLFTDKKESPETAISYNTLLLEAAEKNGKKFDKYNAEFQIKEAGVVYDWSKCNDPELAGMLEQQKELDAKVKARQDFLKTVSISGLSIAVDDELVTVYPPAKSSTTTIALKLK